jgi:succinate dehydrogenase cytochrome b556 subunit
MGVFEWFKIYHWNREKLLFVFHRITGWALTAFIIGHVVFVHQITLGENMWGSLLSLEESILSRIILLLVAISLTYHGLNGIRILLIELGYLLPRPKEQFYPYSTWLSSSKHKVYIIIMSVIGSLLSIYTGVILFR